MATPQAPGDGVDGVRSVAGVADRILAGVNGNGEATAVIELGAGDWAGTHVNLVAGARGLEVSVYAATDAARRVIQAKLSSLARALAERGIAAKKIEVSTRRDNRGGSRQDGRR